MNLTKTTNSMLAKHISMDASYISRLRTGDRIPAKKAEYIQSMARYFAKQCKEETQKEALLAALNTSVPEAHSAKAEDLIYLWLSSAGRDISKPVGFFLDQLSNLHKMPASKKENHEKRQRKPRPNSTEIFYGNDGKRLAVLQFMQDILNRDTQETLLLFSEENQDWLTEKRDFTIRWANLLRRVIERGNKVKIIHNISRNLDEMLTAIAEWLPIYMTGMVEPYYYPKTRDGVFQRTLFIAPGQEALLSTSVSGRTTASANYLVRDTAAVNAAVAEFNDYFELCRPLLSLYPANKRARYLQAFDAFIGEKAETIIKTAAPSIMTLPERALASAGRSFPAADLAAAILGIRKTAEKFESHLQEHRFHELLQLPDIDDIRAGRLPMPTAEFLDSEVYYTAESYRQHLENVVALLKRHKNYHIYLQNEQDSDSIFICVKEDIGVIVSKRTVPAIVFELRESRLTAAFWDYLCSFIGRDFRSTVSRKRTIERLESIIKIL